MNSEPQISEPRCPACGGLLSSAANGTKTCLRCALGNALGLAGAEQPGQSGVATVLTQPLEQDNGEPQRFGDYQLLEEIARGGMGVVYRARQLSLDRIVAVKMLLFGPMAGKDYVQRFRVEASAAAGLQHPNIVAVHEVGVHQNQHYLVMDYIAGQTLSKLSGGQPLPPRAAAKYVKTIAEAIHFAHERGILHRDLKPSNVLIDQNDEPRVTDFGLAKRLDADSDLTMSGQVLGSPNYMAPEQASGKRGKVGRHSDVYSLGAILFHLLTGRPPFVAESVQDTIQLVLEREPITPRALVVGLPRDLETLCLRCLEKEPAKRYATAKDLADELGRFLQYEPILARPITRPERLWRWCRRKPALAGFAGATLMLLLTLAIGAPIAAYRINQARQAVASQSQRVAASAKALRRSLYLADMNAAQLALRENNRGRAIELLNKYFPNTNEDDLRGVEWRYLWKLCDGDELFTLDYHGFAVSAVVFSPDGKWLAVASFDNKVTILDVATQRICTWLPDAFNRINNQGLAFSPDGKILASTDNLAVNLWETDRWSRLRRLEGEGLTGDSVSLAFSPDGKILAIAAKQKLLLWSPSSGEQLASIQTAEVPTWLGSRLAFAPDRGRIAVSGADRIEVFDTESWSKVAEFRELPNSVLALAWFSNSLAAAHWGGMVKIWDTNNGHEVVQMQADPNATVALAFSPDGKTLATAGVDQRVHLWDVSALTEQSQRSAASGKPGTLTEIGIWKGHQSEVWSLAFSPDGQRLATGSKDGTAKLWHSSPSRAEAALLHTRNPLIFSRNGGELLTFNNDGTLTWWDSRSKQKLHGIDLTMPTNGFLAETISSDAKILVLSRTNGMVEIWNLESGQQTAQRKVSDAKIYRLRLSANNRVLLATGEKGVGDTPKRLAVVWDLDSNRLKEIPPGLLFDSELSPDGRIVASDTADYGVHLWDVPKERPLRTLKGHTWIVGRPAFSPDGKWLASPSWDNTIRLWDTASWEVRVLGGNLTGVRNLVFSPDGSILAARGTAENAVKLWNVTPGRDMAIGQELLNLQLEQKDFYEPLVISPDGSALALGEDRDDSSKVLLMRAPAIAEVEARRKAQAELTISVSDKSVSPRTQ